MTNNKEVRKLTTPEELEISDAICKSSIKQQALDLVFTRIVKILIEEWGEAESEAIVEIKQMWDKLADLCQVDRSATFSLNDAANELTIERDSASEIDAK